jgi:hypothetical protein
MTASRSDIRRWVEEGVEKGASHVIIAVDTWDYDNYPIYVMPGENARSRVNAQNAKSMQRVDECYDLSMDIEEQLGGGRVFTY